MKVAIVCDWLVTYAGAERLLGEIIQCYPEADLFAVIDFLPPEKRVFLKNKQATTTFIQKLPFAQKKYRAYLPLMPLAIEQLDVSKYDLVISNSHAVAKGVITGPDQVHVSFVCSPMRYAWDLQHQYLKESGLETGMKGYIAKYFLHKMRLWDQRTAHGVDHFLAISQFISRRIWKTYRREADVIYPPVDVHQFVAGTQKDDFYLTASRFVPYKKIDLIVESFTQMPDKKLIVIGDGPDFAKVKAKAGKNIELLGYQPTDKLIDYMQKAKAFVFAAEEDFGIVPLEAQACGTPVIAYGKGAALETIRGLDHEAPSGVFFNEQTTQELCRAINLFEQSKITAENCRNNALQFSPEKFQEKFKQFIGEKTRNF
ncbi:MAG: glycosyltransferase family 4 protein [Gammaproteobacteria bacterium]